MSNVVTPKIKKHVSTFTIRLELFPMTGHLLPIRLPKSRTEVTTHFASPAGNRVIRVWQDVVTGAVHMEDELGRLTVQNGTETVVDKDVLAEAKKDSSLLPNVMNLTVHPTEQVDHYLFPSDNNAYIFIPDPVAKPLADVFAHALREDADRAMVGQALIKGTEGLYRLIHWRGYLVVQRQCYASDLHEHPVNPTADVASRELGLVKKLMAFKTEEFEPDNYRNVVAERVRAAVAALDSTSSSMEVTQPKVSAKKDPDLVALLEAYLDAKPE